MSGGRFGSVVIRLRGGEIKKRQRATGPGVGIVEPQEEMVICDRMLRAESDVQFADYRKIDRGGDCLLYTSPSPRDS